MTSASDRKDPARPRTQSRDERRLQVIEATIASLAERGFSRTKLTDVARLAGISHGLILFHFQSKENLLFETLTYMSEEYEANWRQAVDRAGDDPEARLRALIEADFDPAVCNPPRMAAWCAFWGEAQSLPMYQAVCGPRDQAYGDMLEETCAGLLQAEGRREDPATLARILRLTIEGTWLEMMTLAAPYSVAEARATVLRAAALMFPRRFGSGQSG